MRTIDISISGAGRKQLPSFSTSLDDDSDDMGEDGDGGLYGSGSPPAGSPLGIVATHTLFRLPGLTLGAGG